MVTGVPVTAQITISNNRISLTDHHRHHDHPKDFDGWNIAVESSQINSNFTFLVHSLNPFGTMMVNGIQ
ncbi:hypothetical protein DERP_000338 [Dermatophagoides pteronyssinus]|uniref:Galectin n=1 Tax=Dermatophagoides pteronyssinus TaxID=6956 RepID=A0ABQ8IZV6_DERPT|nr:hypothetical protein DERP_000338 [Dermatophagoides pteronyssinus]